MNELARHLMEDGSHGALPFHAGCPVCRSERLAGQLPAPQVVSARTRAGLAAAVLAASAGAPATALATDPPAEVDEETEGSADPGAADPDGVAVPVGAPPTPTIPDPAALDGDDADDAALESEGTAEADPVEAPEADDLAAPPAAPAVPVAPVAEPPQVPAAAPAPPPVEKAAKRAPKRSAPKPARAAPAPAPAAAPVARAPVPVAQAITAPAPAPRAAPVPAATGAKVHVVQRGESLWTIARDRLDSGATSAEIAREVQRIWDLNADAIGTGDPNLVMAGQKLRLR